MSNVKGPDILSGLFCFQKNVQHEVFFYKNLLIINHTNFLFYENLKMKYVCLKQNFIRDRLRNIIIINFARTGYFTHTCLAVFIKVNLNDR
jgi:hypothetical protein